MLTRHSSGYSLANTAALSAYSASKELSGLRNLKSPPVTTDCSEEGNEGALSAIEPKSSDACDQLPSSKKAQTLLLEIT
jgi:hypothetical protein